MRPQSGVEGGEVEQMLLIVEKLSLNISLSDKFSQPWLELKAGLPFSYLIE